MIATVGVLQRSMTTRDSSLGRSVATQVRIASTQVELVREADRVRERSAAITALGGQLDSLGRDLATRTGEVAETARAVADARRRLDELTFTGDVQAGTLLERGALLADLQACLRAADQALNLSATGAETAARDATAAADDACGRAEAAVAKAPT